MKLEYYGHSFWRVVSGEVSIVLDPFNNIGYPMPHNLTADYVIISHEHHDHNNYSLIKGNPQVIRTSGMHKFPAFTAELISVFHDDVAGARRGKNNLIKLNLEGLTLVHCGDLGHVPASDALIKIDKPDVLLVPVGEVFTLSLKEVRRFIASIQPRLVIPMHYNTSALSFDLGNLDAFTSQVDNVIHHPSNVLDITAELLSSPKTITIDWSAKDKPYEN